MSVALAVAAAGCGGGSSGSGGSNTTRNSARPAPDPGHALFTSVGCSSCHTLAAAGAHGQVGPNLDTLKPSAKQVAKQVTNGGGGMPAFKDQLGSAQIRQVASYVAKVAGG
ncbi:cytochrome c [Baekduia sp.]|uniref:c-type cytochrome n=1 Tax=Baekduia sp. TaxID=2600305 RepID=UPI002DFA099E|nr:cytochrome c [Baekduia sp.]